MGVQGHVLEFQSSMGFPGGFKGGSKSVPEGPRSFQGLPRIVLEVSEGFQLVSGVSKHRMGCFRVSGAFQSFKGIPGHSREFQWRSRSVPEEPRRFQGLPRTFQEVSCGFRMVSGGFRSVPGDPEAAKNVSEHFREFVILRCFQGVLDVSGAFHGDSGDLRDVLGRFLECQKHFRVSRGFQRRSRGTQEISGLPRTFLDVLWSLIGVSVGFRDFQGIAGVLQGVSGAFQSFKEYLGHSRAFQRNSKVFQRHPGGFRGCQ